MDRVHCQLLEIMKTPFPTGAKITHTTPHWAGMGTLLGLPWEAVGTCLTFISPDWNLSQ